MFRHSWLLFVIATTFNGGLWWLRAQPRIDENPALRKSYARLIRGWLIYGNVPWLVMGMGILLGGVPSPITYFNPRNGPFVFLFYLSVVAIWAAMFRWLFFKQGAEELVRHPGCLNFSFDRPWEVKALFLTFLAVGVCALVLMLYGNTPIPPLGK